MSDGRPYDGHLRTLRSGLRSARHRVRLRRSAAGLSDGINAATIFLIVWAIAGIGYTLISNVRGGGQRIDGRIWYVAAAGVLVLIAWHIVRSTLRRTPDANIAERVDAAMLNHNRIATALDLVSRGDEAPLAQAAVADGVAAATMINRAPLLEDVPWRWRRNLGRVIAVGACWAILFIVMRIDFSGKGVEPPEQVATVAGPAKVAPDASHGDPRAPRIERPNAAPKNDAPTNGVSLATTPLPSQLAQAQQSPSAGGTSGGATSGNAAGGDPAGGAEAKRPKDPAPPNTKQTQGKPSLGSGMGGGVQGTASGAVGSGGKGGGGKSLALENESRRQDAAEMESGDDAGGDPAPPDESDENRHRGGAQPLLQDRAQSPTRELGLGGLKGKPGTGRGGPTPTKKARGAGALLLGVPIPDFVPGKLLAGTSKIARENIRPRRADLPNPPAGQAVPLRSEDENAMERYDVAEEDADAVLRYLSELHRDEASPPPGSPEPPAPAPAPLSSANAEESRSR